MLAFENITVRYGDFCAVDDVTVRGAAGEWVGLIGPNGAGKSTLIRAAAGLAPHTGTVTVDDQPLHRLSQRRRARFVAYVPQQPELPAGMTLLDYVMLGRTPHIGYLGVESQDDRTYCFELLDRLGIARLAARMLPTLSGGELQRATLARALAQQAPVLLLDEPTSALDLGNRVEALELVDEVRAERELTVISAIHDLTLAAQFTDRIVLLADGRTAASGPPADVLTEPVLSRHFGGHVRVRTDDDGTMTVMPVRAPRRPRPPAAPTPVPTTAPTTAPMIRSRHAHRENSAAHTVRASADAGAPDLARADPHR